MSNPTSYQTRYYHGKLKLVLLLFGGWWILSTELLAQQKVPSIAALPLSIEQEQELGELWLRATRKSIKILDDPITEEYIEKLVFKLIGHSNISQNKFHVLLIDDAEINAFAAPGGIIAVNSGLIRKPQKEGELASIIGHEIAHLKLRHFSRRLLSKQQNSTLTSTAFLTSLGLILLGQPGLGVPMILGSTAYTLEEQLRYSRQHEDEADNEGLQILVKSGYAATDAVNMMQILQQQGTQNKDLAFLSTHPLTAERITTMRARGLNQTQSNKNTNNNLNFELIKIRLDLLANHSAETNKKTTDVKNNTSLKGIYAAALQQMLADNCADALRHTQELAKFENYNYIIQASIVEINARCERPLKAIELANSYLPFYPTSSALNKLLATLLFQNEQNQQAQEIYTALTRQRKNDPTVWLMLAQVAGRRGDLITAHQAQAEYYQLYGEIGSAVGQLEQALAQKNQHQLVSAKIKQRITELNKIAKKLANEF